MPCSDGFPSGRVEYVESGNQTKRLCAVFSVLEQQGILNNVLTSADWTEAGVSRRSTEEWWTRHKQEDTARRKREAADRRRAAERRAVLMKLSPEERALLGVK